MRLIFLYMSYGAATEGTNQPWDKTCKSENRFVSHMGLPTEGYFYMLKKMLEEGIIDDLIIFIESNRSPGCAIMEGIPVYVVPEIKYVDDFLQEGDVIFARGGFRGWFNWLHRKRKEGHWLMLYAANTGRSRWKVWDLVFDDLKEKHWFDKRNNRFFFQFKKPINPQLFKPMKTRRDYDVCIGASHIHDKKAQWKTIKALVDLQMQDKLDQRKPRKYVLPGALKNGVHTNHIINDIKEAGLNVEIPGMVHRFKLNEYYNRSKLFVYLGNSGQNDRGPLEAMSVGCPIMLGGTTRHSHVLWKNQVGCKIATDPNNPAVTAGEIRDMIDLHTEGLRVHNQTYFDNKNGIEKVVIPDMAKLFGLIRANVNRKEKAEVLRVAYGIK